MSYMTPSEENIMAIDTKNFGPIQAYQKLTELNESKLNQSSPNSSEQSKGVENALERVSSNVTKAEMRVEQQASLVSHLFGDGATTLNSAMKITYQSAIEKLNEILMANQELTAATDGAQKLDNTVNPISEEALQSQGGMEYWTPENTAKRIVEGASAFFASFQTANPELEGEALMDKFIDVVGGGLSKGFDEARSILGDLNVLEGDISDNIDLTYGLVQDGLETYQKEFLASLADLN